MPRSLIPLLALGLVLAACGDDDAATTTAATPTTEATTTTTVPQATTAAPTTTEAVTTTLAPSTTATVPYFSVAWYGMFPDPLLTAADGHGSGCAPPGDVLPAGMWFGFAKGFSAGTLTFDLACFFTGAAGVAAATADGEVGYDLDFYIRNMNPKLFTIDLDPDGTAYWIDASGPGVTPSATPMTNWPVGAGYVTCPGDHCAVWLFVNDGVVTELVEQYLP
ncbi:MAG TPA: hypothetical protein VK960_10255 [Acidimicrobiia bacterium]|nr:hypothetical protein [Acidimicrobiia bacterium]